MGSVVSRSISVSLGVLLSHSITPLSSQWYVQVSYLISLLARVFAFVWVSSLRSLVHNLLPFCSVCLLLPCSLLLPICVLRSYCPTFKFTCHLSYSLRLVNPFKFKCHFVFGLWLALLKTFIISQRFLLYLSVVWPRNHGGRWAVSAEDEVVKQWLRLTSCLSAGTNYNDFQTQTFSGSTSRSTTPRRRPIPSRRQCTKFLPARPLLISL